jgi:uncharacterized protein YbjT (DUF2867 family)
MTRSEEVAGSTVDGVSYVKGDLEDPASLGPVFGGIDRLHLLTPVHPNEAALGAAAIDAAQNTGVGRIVLHSVHRVDDAPQIPHFASKIRILEAIETSGIPWVTVEPNNYYQNDYWLKDPILQMGIYPSPVGSVGLSRVDVRDIADATVNALLDEGHEGVRYPLVGPEVLTGEDTAAAWSRGLGREIHYVGDDLDAWEEAARGMMPEWMVEDVRIMFEHFLARGLTATDEDLALQDRVLGHPPRRFEDFVAETVAMWTEG